MTSDAQQTQLQRQDSRPNEHDLLIAWYLAGLRRSSTAQFSALTPIALINEDRKYIEKLVVASAPVQAPTATYRQPLIGGRLVFIISSTMIAGSAALICQLAAGAANIFSWAAMISLVFVLATAALALFLVQRKLLNVLDDVGLTLATGASRTISAYEELPNAVSTLLKQRDEYASGEKLIVDSANRILCCLDSELRILASNRASNQLLHFVPEELIGALFTRLVLPEDKGKFLQATGEARKGQSITALELRVLSKKGNAVDVSLTLDWSESNQLYFVLAADITDSKMLERARREFISTMGHDIKIPLSAVWLSLQGLAAGADNLSSNQSTLIRRAENNIERLIALIDELLEYERSQQSGGLPLTNDFIVISELIDQSVETVATQARARNIELRTDAPAVTMLADESKIQRVLVNLISNAVKFSPENTSVEITATVENGVVEVRVRDNGPGIPEDYRQLVFNRYERLPSAEDIEGTGLGLSICKTIIESHGGLIGVSPASGGGSEFWFTLPVQGQPDKLE